MKKIDKHETAGHNLYYSKVCIDLLSRGLERMLEERTTIEEFHQVLNQVKKLHQVQMEIIELEDSLHLPSWNGDFIVRQ
jgi:hypothetical protein